MLVILWYIKRKYSRQQYISLRFAFDRKITREFSSYTWSSSANTWNMYYRRVYLCEKLLKCKYTNNTCTTSMPFITLPKTVCLLSSQGVASVVMKNWEPFVFGPAFAIETMKGLSCRKLQIQKCFIYLVIVQKDNILYTTSSKQ